MPETVTALVVEEPAAPNPVVDAELARDLLELRLGRHADERTLENPVVEA